MAKYKLLTKEGYRTTDFVKGEVYDGLFVGSESSYTVEDLAIRYPEDWELVEDTAKEEEGLRFNDGKLRYDLIHPKAIEGLVKVMTKGSIKYAERNWEKGMKWTTVIASLKRHLAAIERGEDYDKETDELHVNHLQCNAHFLSAYYNIYVEGDDRPKTYFNKRIGLDIDGVLNDFNKAVKEKYDIKNNPNHWLYSYKFGSWMWEELAKDEDFWLNSEAYFDGEKLPFEPVCYVTQRSIPTEITQQWLEKNNFPCAPVETVGESKVEAIRKYNVDYFVDDKYENFVKLNKAGICTFLLSRPWNEKYDVGHKRIHSLEELYERIR